MNRIAIIFIIFLISNLISLVLILCFKVVNPVLIELKAIAIRARTLFSKIKLWCFNLLTLSAFTFFQYLAKLNVDACLSLKMLCFLSHVLYFHGNFLNNENFVLILSFLNVLMFYLPYLDLIKAVEFFIWKNIALFILLCHVYCPFSKSHYKNTMFFSKFFDLEAIAKIIINLHLSFYQFTYSSMH